MTDKSFGGRMLAFLSSLRLAVVAMLTLGAVCAYATFYEMRNGTPAAQRAMQLRPLQVRVEASGDTVTVTITYLEPTDVPLIGALLPDVEVSATVTMAVEPP